MDYFPQEQQKILALPPVQRLPELDRRIEAAKRFLEMESNRERGCGMRNTADLPKICIFDDYSERVEQTFNQFRSAHPTGSIVSAKVLLVNREVAIVDLGLGLQGRLDRGESLDHTPGSKVQWLPLPRVGERLDVMVRGFIARIRQVSVSLHTFHRDDGYCNYAAGYRHQFDTADACFRKLPWENKRC